MPLRHKGECAMKKISRVLIAVILAVLMATLMPAQVFADTPDYISEVKVYQGSFDKAAEEGFTILNGEDGKPVDLNQGSGSTDTGAKGNKKIYLGYKTTKNRKEAITDLALMNMKGGYDVAEYEKLMEGQMSEQIIPFVDMFLAAINEYRENYNSENSANRERARYLHDILNKLTDDDCGGAGLGDLLLNETVYEMAKPKYDALSDKEKEKKSMYDVNVQVRDSLPESEKNKHADILTIIAQSNGQATILIQNLLTRAADTSDDTWVERFEDTTYDDLLELQGGSPADAMKKLAKKYDDDANTILACWDDFQDFLNSAEEAEEAIENAEEIDYDGAHEAAQQLEEDGELNKDNVDEFVDLVEANLDIFEFNSNISKVSIYEFLNNTEYGDGTLLDFFMQSSEDIEDDITVLYPLVASLSNGQRAGLGFVSLSELIAVAATNPEEYSKIDTDNVSEASIYSDVDRGIYEKGGVALTSDALRADALKLADEGKDSIISKLTIFLWGLTAVSGIALAGSVVLAGEINTSIINNTKNAIENELIKVGQSNRTIHQEISAIQSQGVFSDKVIPNLQGEYEGFEFLTFNERGQINFDRMDDLVSKPEYSGNISWSNNMGAALVAGVTVAMIALTAVSIYLTYKDMCDFYDVDFSPVPHYMVDEKDLIGYNAKGERIVLKNQSAYYKAVESNRKKGDDYFKEIDTCADMNGCVNPQWLALYAAKNEAEVPILASSLKVVVGSSDVPEGYETGIHMFGESAAFNLNDKRFCWNQKAKSVMVYYKVDNTAATTAGSNFTSGTLALAAGGGLFAGVAITALGMVTTRKRKENKAVTA